MLQRILMPTDGSPESERPIPLVTQLAIAQGANVALVRVVRDDDRAAATTQLEAIAAKMNAAGISRVATKILEGDPAAVLLDYIRNEGPDIVVMASHGRTGWQRITMGSVADRIVREGDAPLLVTRVTASLPSVLERALVLLDGSLMAEEVFPLLKSLFGRPIRRVKLMRAVVESSEYDAAEAYLRTTATRLAAEGLPTETLVQIGGWLPSLDQAARESDFVLLCTHGRGGLDRLWHGSVAEEVMSEGSLPALLVRSGAPPSG